MLCAPVNAEKLSRLIITAYSYQEELRVTTASAEKRSENIYKHVTALLDGMKAKLELAKAYLAGKTDGDWTALAEYFTS